MKAIFASVLTLFAVTANAATTLTHLECTSTNGVSIETLEVRERSLLLETKLGFFTKSFSAKIYKLATEDNQETEIELKDLEADDDYMLTLPIATGDNDKQVVYGALSRQGDGVVFPFPVAAVRCEVKLGHTRR